MIKILEETTKNPITLMGQRAGVCWNSSDTPEANYKRGLDCLASNHGRVQEFVNVEMVINGYSARVIREWYTHIGGAPTRLQESTRYVTEKGFNYITPHEIVENADTYKVYRNCMEQIDKSYELLLAMGISKEDAAMLLPLGMTTKIVDKRNLRNLMEMSRQRLCNRAYWEYRQLMIDIMDALRNYSHEWAVIVDNYFYPKCVAPKGCKERKPCGKAAQVGNIDVNNLL